MKHRTFLILVFLSDLVMSVAALLVMFFLRFRAGIIPSPVELYYSDLIFPAAVLYLYWLAFYLYFDLYSFPAAPSRFDETLRIFKTHIYGILFLFLLTFDITRPLSLGRLSLLAYMVIHGGFTVLGRIFVISIQRNRYLRGIGLKNVLIVGFNEYGFDIFRKIRDFPALGYKVVGFITLDLARHGGKNYEGVDVLGDVDGLPELIQSLEIRELVIAFESSNHEKLLDVISGVGRLNVGLKIIPDMYDIISGQARTNQIYGFPLIDIFPQLMPRWEKLLKRSLDVTVSLIALILWLPFSPIFALLIRLDSKGPVFYRQERLGRNGRPFMIIKYRTMISDAEAKTGAVWASKNDPRITRLGNFLRKSRIDEIPQFINVLRNEMSLVGPRPERKVFIDDFVQRIPLYKHRLKMKPGITGWAQIMHKYDESFEDVKKKLQYDLYYLENMSIRLDIKIILSTLSVMLSRKGQ